MTAPHLPATTQDRSVLALTVPTVPLRLVTSSPNLPWLVEMEGAIDTVRRQLATGPTNPSGRDLLLKLRDVAQANLKALYERDPKALPNFHAYLFGESKHVGGFGDDRAPRVDGDVEAIHRTHYQTRYARHLPDIKAALDRFGSEDFEPSAPLRFEEVGRGYASAYNLGGQSIRLTEVFFSREQGRLRGDWSPMMRCIGRSVIPTAFVILDREVSRWHETSGAEVATQIEVLARVHWAASHAWPFDRGSAALADMLTKLLSDMRGLTMPNWRAGVDPNIVALITPEIELFSAQYSSLFTPPTIS